MATRYLDTDWKYLMGLQVVDDSWHGGEDLFHKGHDLAHLQLDKHCLALDRYLDKSITGHVLDTFMPL
jgi:hypothetical protein